MINLHLFGLAPVLFILKINCLQGAIVATAYLAGHNLSVNCFFLTADDAFVTLALFVYFYLFPLAAQL